MRKIYIKLVAITLSLLLSVSVVVMTSYAWFVLSESPVVTGIQVTIGGGNTILIAADMTEEVDGVIYHYPGYFSDTINFSQLQSYSYLRELGGLTPVSTADGVNWFLPAYYDTTDAEVREGRFPSGQLKDISEFYLDDGLEYANLLSTEAEKIAEGSYIYLDFWVVAPGGDFTLRVSAGDDSGGSFLMELLQPVQGEDGSYTLEQVGSTAVAAARVGFLANPDYVSDNTMLYYQRSYGYDSRFTRLRGLYQEKDGSKVYSSGYRFTIYEPNGDYHPGDESLDGSYVITDPIGLVNGKATEVSVSRLLTVQLASRWAAAENGEGTAIEQRFQTAILNMDLEDMDATEIGEAFYSNYLQWQITPYVDKAGRLGDFIDPTSNLYSYGTTVSAGDLANLGADGATDEVYIIELERNVPQRIRMFIWLEGQDVDCTESVETSGFTINIELAGGSE